jgi:hypothetical protein
VTLRERARGLGRRLGIGLGAWVTLRDRARGGAPGMPEAGTGTQHVQCVGRWGQAALRLRYVQCAGGWYACPVRTVRRPRAVRVSSGRCRVYTERSVGYEGDSRASWLGVRG